MASIRKRGDTWRAEIRRKGYRRMSATFDNREDAEEWADDIERDMKRGRYVNNQEANTTTLKEALLAYKKEVTPHKKGSKRESNRINQLASLPFAEKKLADIRSVDIARYRDERLKKVSPSTVKKEISLISQVFVTCVSEWGIDGISNPTSGIKIRNARKKRTRRISNEEQELILSSLDSPFAEFTEFALETAMRRGEIYKLEWKDVVLSKNYVMVLDPKNSEDRAVPLSKRAIEIIKSLPRNISGRIFDIGHIDNITHHFLKACRENGIEDMRFHDTRHEATSRLFELTDSNGNYRFEMMEIMSITGHKTISEIKGYTHLRGDKLSDKLRAASPVNI